MLMVRLGVEGKDGVGDKQFRPIRTNSQEVRMQETPVLLTLSVVNVEFTMPFSDIRASD